MKLIYKLGAILIISVESSASGIFSSWNSSSSWSSSSQEELPDKLHLQKERRGGGQLFASPDNLLTFTYINVDLTWLCLPGFSLANIFNDATCSVHGCLKTCKQGLSGWPQPTGDDDFVSNLNIMRRLAFEICWRVLQFSIWRFREDDLIIRCARPSPRARPLTPYKARHPYRPYTD